MPNNLFLNKRAYALKYPDENCACVLKGIGGEPPAFMIIHCDYHRRAFRASPQLSYSIALQRLVESVCHRGTIPEEVTRECPHHAEMAKRLLDRLKALESAATDVVKHIAATRESFEKREKLDFGGYATGECNFEWIMIRLQEGLGIVPKDSHITTRNKKALAACEKFSRNESS